MVNVSSLWAKGFSVIRWFVFLMCFVTVPKTDSTSPSTSLLRVHVQQYLWARFLACSKHGLDVCPSMGLFWFEACTGFFCLFEACMGLMFARSMGLMIVRRVICAKLERQRLWKVLLILLLILLDPICKYWMVTAVARLHRSAAQVRGI